MSWLRALLATAAVAVLIIAGAVLAGIVSQNLTDLNPEGRNEIARDGSVQGRLYRGDPAREPKLVLAEQQRLSFVRDTSASVPWRLQGVDGPYRLPGAPATTLVLTPRPAPYTAADLARLAPKTFTRQADGSRLLSENVVALPGASLDLSDAPHHRIELLSTPAKFVSIVTIGGRFAVAGTAATPVSFVSHDPATGSPDTTTADGRAYVRMIGGTAKLQYAAFRDLGFWSGDTAGLSLTGVDASALATSTGSTQDSQDGGARTLSEPEISTLSKQSAPQPGAVSGMLTHVTASGNAFGLFVTRASGLTITGSRVTGSLIDGIVLHRFVTRTTIRSTSTTGNAVDGLTMARSASEVTLQGVTASTNGRNGISVDGRPLADGPSAAGTPVNAFGGIRIDSATVSSNARYGIELMGTRGASIIGSKISGNIVGIVLDDGARTVDVGRNSLTHQGRQAIAVAGGATGVTVHDNRISSVDTGVRIAGASATVEHNDLAGISRHGITLAGTVTGTRVVRNTIAGTGTAPIMNGATGGHVSGNTAAKWKHPVTARSILSTIAQPLTLVWVTLGVLVLLTALAGHRRRGIRDPFADHLPLARLSRGVVSPQQARGERS